MRQSTLTSLVALVAVLSGLLLDLTVAAVFGAGRETDAFVVAARLPLGLSAVVMVVANQVLVPSFTTWAATLPAATRRRIETTTVLSVVALMVSLAGLMSLLAEPLAHLLAPGFDDAQTALAAELSRIMVWYLPCVAAAEVLRCWLNSRMLFAVPAAMTLILNGVGVAIILYSPTSIDSVAWAYVGGSAAQLVVMGAVAARKGMRLSRPDWRHEEVRRTAALCIRPSLGAGLNPLVRVVEVFFASFLPSGSATIVHYANRLTSAIGGTVIFRSVIVALLPRLTRAWGAGARTDFDDLVRLGLKMMLLVAVPMGLLGAVLAPEAAQLVFGIGRFDGASAALLGTVLAVYALSFPGSGIQRALLAPSFAQRDTKTPLRNTVYGAVANLALLPLLVLPFNGAGAAVVGMAAAYSLAQYVNVAHAWWRVRHDVRVDLSPVRPDLIRAMAGSVLAAAAAGGLLLATEVDGRAARAVLWIAAALVGACVYAVVLLTDPTTRRRLRRLRRIRRRESSGTAAAPTITSSTISTNGTTTSQPASPTDPSGRHTQGRPSSPVRTFRGKHMSATDVRESDPAKVPKRSSALTRLRSRIAGSLQNTAFAVILGVALTVYTTVGLVNDAPKLSIMLPLGVVVAGALALIAINDAETFVLVALAIRSSLDALKLGDSAAIDPGALLGLFVLGLGVVWLLNRRSQVGAGAYPSSRLGTSMVIFIGVAMLGIVTSAAPLTSVIEWSRIASIAVVYLVVEQLAARARRSAAFVGAIGAAVLIPAAVAFSQVASGQGLFEAGGFSRITGTFTHSNPMAYFCSVVTVALVALVPFTRKRRRTALLCVLAVTLPLLLLTYTRSAWLATFCGIVVMILNHNRKLILPLVGGIVALLLVVPSVGDRFSDLETAEQISGQPANSMAWRLQYWGEALALSESSPITGVGLKAVASTTEEAKQPHNDFVRAFVELGVPGLLAYTFMLFQLVRRTLTAVRVSERLQPHTLERGVALASLGVATVVVVLSCVANLMSQVVIMWYAVSVVALASGNLMRAERVERLSLDPTLAKRSGS